jgi:hypothetical protein
MHAKVGVARTRANGMAMKASPAYLISQLSNLVLGSACFIVAISATSYFANGAKQAFLGRNLSVSPSLYSWATQIHPVFSANTIAAGTASSISGDAMDSLESAAISKEVGQGLQKIAQLEDRAKHQRHAILSKKSFVAVHHAHPVAKTIAQATPVDSVQTSQAAVEVIPMTEAEKLQKVHAELTRHFYLAMNGAAQIVADTSIQSVDPMGIPFKSDLDIARETAEQAIAAQKAQKHIRSAARKKAAPAAKESVAMASAPQPEAPTDYSETRLHAAAALVNTGPSEIFKLGRMATQMDNQAAHPSSDSQLSRVDKVQMSEAHPEVFTPPAVPLVLANVGQDPPPAMGAQKNMTTSGDTQSSAPTYATSGQALAQMAQVGRAMWNGYSPKVQGSTTQGHAGYPTAPTKQLATQINTQSVTQATTPLMTPAVAPSQASAKTGPVSLNDTVHISSAVETEVKAQASFEKGARWNFAEAFEWNQPVAGAQVEVLSHEGGLDSLGNARTGWRIARSSQHWGTLFWARSSVGTGGGPSNAMPSAEEIPLLQSNSAKLLAFKAGTTVQADAGIVIAKVPAGWSLEFSGRAERALVFDRANRPLAASSVDEDRYYVFLNASPGEQILYLTRSTGETGALAVPVLGSLVAYVDMTQVQKKTITGRILNVGSDSAARGLPGMRIQVVGSSASAVSGTKGIFKIENVMTFGDQAIYLETESQKSFPHRYKFSPNSLENLTMFNMSDDQVHDWVGQLEGGMSSESGLIVGALPTLASSEEDRKPQIETRSLSLSPTLSPETYTLSSSGQLLVKNPLTAVHSRFVSVQVPEGPTLVQALDKDGKVIWSEITVVSPRVLTVVGPY